MKIEYWVEQILGNLYAVKHDNGNYSVIDYEGTYDECLFWINNN